MQRACLDLSSTGSLCLRIVIDIGARRLHTIMTNLLEELMFNIPESVTEEKVVIDEAMVQDKLSAVSSDRDLSQYIL